MRDDNTAPRNRNGFPLRGGAFAFAAFILCCAFTVSGAALKATLERDTILVGENINLTLQFEDAQLPGNPNLPSIPGLRLLGISQNVSTSIVNGQSSSVQSFIFAMTATQPGDIEIPSFQVEVDGKKLSSTPLKLKVLREDPAQPPAFYATNMAFIWPVLPARDLFVGEAFVFELRLYLRSEVGNIGDLNIPAPAGDGLNMGKWIQGQQFRRNVGSASFTVLPLLCSATVIKSGQLKPDAITGSVMLYGGRQDFFGRYTQSAKADLRMEMRPLNALPLPAENVPPGFSGSVGDYAITASVGPTNVATGDPVTVRIQISGRGALDSIQLPADMNLAGFKSYPPTSSIEAADQFGLQGRKNFEQIVSPENADVKELPALTFSYFDPVAKSYRTLVHPPTPLTVRPGGSAPAPVIAANNGRRQGDAAPQQVDIVPVKQRPGTPQKNPVPLLRQKWFLTLNAVPVLVFIAAFAWRSGADSLARNPRLRRRRQVEKTVRDGLAELRTLAEANKSDEFFALLFRLMQEQLGDTLDCPAGAITEAVVDEKPAGEIVPEAVRATLRELFQTCNQARYAPVRSVTELESHRAKFGSVIEELRRMRR